MQAQNRPTITLQEPWGKRSWLVSVDVPITYLNERPPHIELSRKRVDNWGAYPDLVPGTKYLLGEERTLGSGATVRMVEGLKRVDSDEAGGVHITTQPAYSSIHGCRGRREKRTLGSGATVRAFRGVGGGVSRAIEVTASGW